MITEEFLEEIQKMKDSVSGLSIDTGELFMGVEEILDNLDNNDNQDSSRFDFTEEELEEAVREAEENCDYVPMEMADELKDILCNFLPGLNENKKRYDTSGLADIMKTGDIESSDPGSLELFQKGCTKTVMDLAESLSALNNDIFEKKEEKGKIEDEAFKVLVEERWMEGRIDILENPEGFEIEDFEDTEGSLEDYLTAKEAYDEHVRTIADFVSQKKEEWQDPITDEKRRNASKFFDMELGKHSFDRTDPDYIEKRKDALRPATEKIAEMREAVLFNAYHQSAFQVAVSVDLEDDTEVGNALDTAEGDIEDLRESEDYQQYLSRFRELGEEIELLEDERDDVLLAIREFSCDDGQPPSGKSPKAVEGDQNSPVRLSDATKVHTPSEPGYWDRWSNLATLVNLTNPLQFWPIGLVIPTPGGLVKIPMPILWKNLAVIPTPTAIVVIFLGMCGICPSPFVFTMEMVSRSSMFLVSLRGPQVIRDSGSLGGGVSSSLNVNASTPFGQYISNASEVLKAPLGKDDLPDWSRLSLSNVPYSFHSQDGDGMLVAFNKAGKGGGGFFENP